MLNNPTLTLAATPLNPATNATNPTASTLPASRQLSNPIAQNLTSNLSPKNPAPNPAPSPTDSAKLSPEPPRAKPQQNKPYAPTRAQSTTIKRLFKSLLLDFRLYRSRTQKTSRKLDIIDLFFCLIAALSLGVLALMVGELSLSDREVKNFFNDPHLFYSLMRYLAESFGQNDFTLKLPLLFLHFLNLNLLYGISRHMLRHKSDSLICVLIYALLPGVNLGALFLVESSWITFFSLLVGYIYVRYKTLPLLLLSLLALLSSGAMVLLLGIGIFTLKHQRIKTFLFCMVGAGLNFYLFDFDVGGRPETYFLGTLGRIAMLYSPLLFLYYAYSIYWGLRQKDNLLAYISATSIAFCIILSLRQNINFYILIPQSLLALPVMLQCFLNDLRVRLPQFRKGHYIFAGLVLVLLLAQSGILLGNKITYLFSPKPNFASSYYFAKEIATELKARKIAAIHTPSTALRTQLRFYGIGDSKTLSLLPTYPSKKADISIAYNGRIISSFSIKAR